MALTYDFDALVAERATRSPAFCVGLYQEAIEEILNGELPAARLLLRDFINATIGFRALSTRVNVPDKSLMRMFGADGNPTAANLIAVLSALTAEYGLKVRVKVTATPKESSMEARPIKHARPARRQQTARPLKKTRAISVTSA